MRGAGRMDRTPLWLGGALVVLLVFLVISPLRRLVFSPRAPHAAAVGVRGPIPVVVVIFDEFAPTVLLNRDDRLNRRRYPHFAELGRISTWYRNATTVSADTTRAVPAILASKGPRKGTIPTTLDYPNNLFTLLGPSYTIQAQEPVTQLCPPRFCEAGSGRPVKARWRHGRAQKSSDFVHFKQVIRDRSLSFARLLHEIGPQRGARPALYFLHIALPHLPYRYLPDGQQYEISGEDLPGIPGTTWVSDPFPVAQAQQRYMLQVGYTDKLVGELTDRMRKAGILQRALLVVTADHGVSFRPSDMRRSPTPTNVNELAGVPLFIKAPGQMQGRINDTHVETIDILPTIADLLGVHPNFALEGHSALSRITRRPVRAGSESVRIPFAEYLRRRDAQVRKEISLFGSGPLSSLYRLGPHPELLGRKVASLRAGAPVPGGISLSNPDPRAWGNVHPRAPLVPAWIRGKVESAGLDGDLAICVNGRIAALTRTSGNKFSALVPTGALRRGRNLLEIARLQPESGGAMVLERLGRWGAD